LEPDLLARRFVKNVEEIFFIPPMAVARVDGSNIPVASFTWKRIRICMGLDSLGQAAMVAELSLLGDPDHGNMGPEHVVSEKNCILNPEASWMRRLC
jgi:hypothetical protein